MECEVVAPPYETGDRVRANISRDNCLKWTRLRKGSGKLARQSASWRFCHVRDPYPLVYNEFCKTTFFGAPYDHVAVLFFPFLPFLLFVLPLPLWPPFPTTVGLVIAAVFLCATTTPFAVIAAAAPSFVPTMAAVLK